MGRGGGQCIQIIVLIFKDVEPDERRGEGADQGDAQAHQGQNFREHRKQQDGGGKGLPKKFNNFSCLIFDYSIQPPWPFFKKYKKKTENLVLLNDFGEVC